MQPQTHSLDVLLQSKSRKTRREIFLSQMETAVPWALLVQLIEPFYPTGKRGRPPIGIERMLRLYFVQLWYNFSDEGTEDALYDMPVLARFVGIDLTSERIPDSTTLKNLNPLNLRKTGALGLARCPGFGKVCPVDSGLSRIFITMGS